MHTLDALACPNCGAQLTLNAQARQSTCRFCGATWSVEHERGGVWLNAPADRMASEITIPRLEKEIDDLILALLRESEARLALRQRLAWPDPKPVLGTILQIAGVVLLMMAVIWALALRFMPTPSAEFTRRAPGAMILVFIGASVVLFGLLLSRAENANRRRVEAYKAEQVTQLERSLARTHQLDAVLANKRDELERHKLVTSV